MAQYLMINQERTTKMLNENSVDNDDNDNDYQMICQLVRRQMHMQLCIEQ